MRIAQQIRRLAPAFLAALVLCASLASAAHSHASASGQAAAIAADPQHASRALGADLDCALCAASARLAHGAITAPTPSPELAPDRFHPPRAGDVAAQRIALSRTEARAPPRLG